MKTVRRIFVLCFILQCFFYGIFAAEDNPSQDYDYYEDDDQKLSQVPNTNIHTRDQTMERPFFEQTNSTINAIPGEDVLINCDVRNLRSTNLIMWYKDDSLITNGNIAISKRIETSKNNSIRIRGIEKTDAGNYSCVVLPEKIRLDVKVEIAKLLAIYNHNIDITNRTITLNEGQTYTLDCKTSSTHDMEIKWSFNDQRAKNVVSSIDEGKLVIDYVDDVHAGIYQCLGDDKSRNPPLGWVSINVLHAPKVSTHRHFVNTELDGEAELYCDFKTNLLATVQWLKNGKILTNSGKHSISTYEHKHRNRTKLTVTEVKSEDLGEYQCLIENNIGSNEATIHIILEPEIPQFENMDINGKIIQMHWLVRSKQPLSEAILDYKLSGSYTWSTTSVIHTKRHTNKDRDLWKIYHEMELPSGNWHARVKTKNTAGWSKFSAQHDFSVHNIDDEEHLDNEVPDTIMRAGVAVPSFSGNNTATTVATSSVLMAASCFTLFFVHT